MKNVRQLKGNKMAAVFMAELTSDNVLFSDKICQTKL